MKASLLSTTAVAISLVVRVRGTNAASKWTALTTCRQARSPATQAELRRRLPQAYDGAGRPTRLTSRARNHHRRMAEADRHRLFQRHDQGMQDAAKSSATSRSDRWTDGSQIDEQIKVHRQLHHPRRRWR